MSLFVSYLPEENLSQAQLNQLINDHRVQIKLPYCFCLQENKQILEQTYNILFCNGIIALCDIFASELSNSLKIFLDQLLDFNLTIQDDFKLCMPSSELFYKDFIKYLLKLRNIFLENINYLLNNFNTCQDLSLTPFIIKEDWTW